MSIILIGVDGKCFCDCAMKCVKGRGGSQCRCSKEEIEEMGYKTLQVASATSNSHVRKALSNKGKLKIRAKT